MKAANSILGELCDLIAKYTKLGRDQINPHIPFLEMGADSMILVRALREIEKSYKVKISIRMLYEKLNNLNALAEYIHTNSNSDQDISNQFQPPAVPYTKPVQENKPSSWKEVVKKSEACVATEQKQPQVKQKASWQTAKPEKIRREYNDQQQQHVEALIRRFNRKTQKSKNLTQKYRAVLADSKATVGFRMSIKEMLYPIVGAKTEGSRLWDIDGNEYVDITMGFGTHLFGYKPDFIANALKNYVENGVQLGPRSEMIGKVAELICELTGMERVAFANTGTEANMATLRLVRAATGKSRIAMFRNSYHGHCDYTLAEGQFEMEDGTLIGVTPGIPSSVLPEVLVLDFGDPEALVKIAEHKDELAAVIVEPVQSRDPLLQPVDFLRELRALTLQLDIPLVFDEMITGFRCHPGGAQGYFGIAADIVTYGKAIGGGLPIGIIAGKAKYLDGIDGGFWSYGDASFPPAERTFFGGTYCQHPMVIPVAHAILTHLKEQGGALQENLSAKTERFANTLNRYFKENKIPIKVSHFASVFRFDFESVGNLDLFYYHMIERGVYIWEWRLCFLTTAHTEADIEFIIQAAKESAEDLRRGGFLPADTPPPQSLVYHPVEEIKELTEEQKQLWILSQIGERGEGSAVYNILVNLKIDGDLNYTVMKQAIQKITDRYEALRSTIDPENLVQRIHSSFKIEVPIVDFTSYDTSAQKSAVDNWILEYGQQPINLLEKPTFQATLLKLSNQSYILALKAHHIFVDGITAGVLLEEIQELYSAGCEIRAPHLLEPVNVFPYSEGHEKERAANLEYWASKYSEPMPDCYLPYDFPRPKSRIHRGCNNHREIEPQLYSKLTDLALQNNSSLYMVLFSLFSSFLYKISRADDIAIATPTSGRYTEETERLVGHYATMLPLRISVDSDDSVLDHLKKTASTIMEAFEYQNFSFLDLCETLKRQESQLVRVNAFPITPILFNLDKLPREITLTDATASLYLSPITSYVDHDLFLNFVDENGRLVLDYHYSTELFHKETMERILKAFIQFMETAVADPAKPIKEIEIITENEKEQILNGFNSTEQYFAEGNKVFHEVFREQARKTPDNIALVFEDTKGERRQYTYKQLDEITDVLAYDLRQKGVARDSFVSIMGERNEDAVIGGLAVNKAGGAYLQIDPAYPDERVQFMLEDCGAKILLTNLSRERLEKRLGAQKLEIIDIAEYVRPVNGRKRVKDKQVPNINQSDDLMVCIYTSGTTGKSKGNILSHKAVINIARDESITNQWCESDRVAAHVNVVFDVFLVSAFAPLTVGAAVYIMPEDIRLSLPETHEYLLKHDITTICMTTQFCETYAREYDNEKLRILETGGEKLVHYYDRHYKIINIYGPTECSVAVTRFPVDKEYANIPVGKPVINTKIYILDKDNKLCSIGVPGELCASGVQVAGGYLKRPELTAERFVENPYYDDVEKKITGQVKNGELPEDYLTSYLPGYQRMYRTGDLARWLPDGNIEFLGRLDNQVKVRGYRIELGEIEAQMTVVKGIKQCAATVKQDNTGRNYLVGYYTQDNGLEATATAIREKLSQHLPEYMVPPYLVAMDKLPLNANGKIDRSVLPDPEYQREEYIAPQTKVELLLTQIWGEVLGIEAEKISVLDDFFNVGGNSIRMMSLSRQINKQFERTLDTKTLFENSQLSKMAKRLEQSTQNGYVPILIFNEHGTKTPLVLIHDGRGGAESYINNLAKMIDKDVPLYLVDNYFRETVGMERFNQEVKIEQAAKKYLAFIKEKLPKGPYRLGGWSFGGMVALEIAQMLKREGDKVEDLIMIDAAVGELSGNLHMYEQWPKPVYDGKTVFFQCGKPPEDMAVEAWQIMFEQHPLNGYEETLSSVEKVLLNCSHYDVLEDEHLQQLAQKINSRFK